MNATKLLTALMAMLVVSAGAGAVSAASIDAETTTVDASYEDGTVILTVDDNGTAVENVSVVANNMSAETDANGTVTFDTNATELDVEFTKDNTTFERSYVIDGDTISEADNEEVEEDESALAANVTYDNGTVDVEVTKNGSAVENVSVTANDEAKGVTDANGSLTFETNETNETEELELEFEKGEMELEQSYTIEDGSLVMAEDEDEEDDKELSANENASDRAHSVLAVIQQFLSSGGEGNLGQQIQDALGDDRGNSENAKQNGNEAGANGNADKADNKGNGNADKADKANNGKQNDKADKKGNQGNGNADDADDDEEDEEDEEEEEVEDDETESDE
jgi:hypothetical protein